MKRFAFTIALVFILVGSAYAQSQSNPADSADLWAQYTFSEKMGGLETAKGTEDFEDDVIWGNAITLTAASSEFTATINRGGVKIDPEFGNKIVGGTWTLHVNKGGQLYGMLFGEFTGGTIEWLRDRRGNILAESISATLVITGGTGAYESTGGPATSGIMTSVASMDTKGFPVHSGSVHLMF